jgi:excisionase family DNA binding protein
MLTAHDTKNNKQKAYMRPAEAAEYASVTRSTIYAWMTSKKLKSYLVGGTRLLKASDIDSFIEANAA